MERSNTLFFSSHFPWASDRISPKFKGNSKTRLQKRDRQSWL